MSTVPEHRIPIHTSERPAATPGPRRRTDPSPLMTPAEVAHAFHVDPKTVTRWARAGKLRSVQTLGGHRRYHRADIEAILCGETPGGVA